MPLAPIQRNPMTDACIAPTAAATAATASKHSPSGCGDAAAAAAAGAASETIGSSSGFGDASAGAAAVAAAAAVSIGSFKGDEDEAPETESLPRLPFAAAALAAEILRMSPLPEPSAAAVAAAFGDELLSRANGVGTDSPPGCNQLRSSLKPRRRCCRCCRC